MANILWPSPARSLQRKTDFGNSRQDNMPDGLMVSWSNGQVRILVDCVFHS